MFNFNTQTHYLLHIIALALILNILVVHLDLLINVVLIDIVLLVFYFINFLERTKASVSNDIL